MPNDSLNECRQAFEKWVISKSLCSEMSVGVWGQPIYKFPAIETMWFSWQGCWELKAEKIEDMRNATMAMSDSLGALANE